MKVMIDTNIIISGELLTLNLHVSEYPIRSKEALCPDSRTTGNSTVIVLAVSNF